MKALDRSGVIRESVSVLICGVAGLLPVIGLFPAVSAIIRSIQIRRNYPELNPVERYRKWGMMLGTFGVLINLCAGVIAVINMDSIIHWNG